MAKKKIKDLTIKDCEKICDKNTCVKCPLFSNTSRCYFVFLQYKLDLKNFNKNNEVEIDD